MSTDGYEKINLDPAFLEGLRDSLGVIGDVDAISPPQPTPLSIDLRSNPMFQGARKIDKLGASWAEFALSMAGMSGHIDLERCRRIIDFGAGFGGPTLALTELVRKNGGVVDAVEVSEGHMRLAVENGFVDPDHAHTADGIDFLEQLEEEGRQVDLVTAFMFGPDGNGDFARLFLNAASSVLKPDGKVLMTSDQGTMSAIERVIQQNGTPYEYVHGVEIDGQQQPSVIIASPADFGVQQPPTNVPLIDPGLFSIKQTSFSELF